MTEYMPKRTLPHVVKQTTRHGAVVYYFRVGKGPRTRLKGSPGSAEFMASYLAAANGESQPVRPIEAGAQSLKWLVDRHRESGYWAGLSSATKRQRENIFRASIEKSGHVDFRAITKATITKAVEARSATPAQANVFLKAMRALFEWALKNDHVKVDPTAGVEMLAYKTKGFEPWTDDDAALFCAKWPIGTMERLAFELAQLSGLRRSDLHKAGRQHLRGNVFQITTTKTGQVVTVEFSEALISIIEKTPSGGLHFITGKHGKPFTAESFGNWFRKAASSAGVNKPLHGVRKLAATTAANEGASAHELMAQFGWATPRQAETYTKGADRIRLGIASSRRIAERKQDK